jgi:hypothetical protein
VTSVCLPERAPVEPAFVGGVRQREVAAQLQERGARLVEERKVLANVMVLCVPGRQAERARHVSEFALCKCRLLTRRRQATCDAVPPGSQRSPSARCSSPPGVRKQACATRGTSGPGRRCQACTSRGAHVLHPHAQVADVVLVACHAQQLARAALQRRQQLAARPARRVVRLRPREVPARAHTAHVSAPVRAGSCKHCAALPATGRLRCFCVWCELCCATRTHRSQTASGSSLSFAASSA